MTAKNYIPIVVGAAANAAIVNAPLQKLDDAIGDLTAMSTTPKTSLAGAIGSTALTTTAKDLTGAISEVDGHADAATAAIGTLASLTTTDKTDAVHAINEVDSHADTVTAEVVAARDGEASLSAKLDAMEAVKLQLVKRQGGSPTDWNTGGTSQYTPSAPIEQVGAYNISMMAGTGQQSQTITFPQAFSAVPLIFFSLGATDDFSSTGIIMVPDSITASAVVLSFTRSHAADSKTYTINWRAIGPE
jgi:hypothetical protein